MSNARRLALAVDDPLASGSERTPEAGVVRPAAKARRKAEKAPVVVSQDEPRGAAAEPEATGGPDRAPGGLWRAWSGGTRPASYRLPNELLDELDERTHGLRLPVGLTVTAALLRLLDESDELIVAAVDRADDAQHQARRRARRRRS